MIYALDVNVIIDFDVDLLCQKINVAPNDVVITRCTMMYYGSYCVQVLNGYMTRPIFVG